MSHSTVPPGGNLGASEDVALMASWRNTQRAELLAAALAASPDIILVHDADGHIIDANTQAQQCFGLSLAQLLALPSVVALCAPGVESSPEMALSLIGAAAQGEPQNFEWAIRTASGASLPVEVRLRAVAHDMPGSRAVVLAVLRDISERHQAQLLNSRYQALVEQSLAGIYIIQDGVLRYCNPLFAAMFGYASAEELIERVPVMELVAPEDRDTVAQNIRRRLMADVSDMRYTFTGLCKCGARIEVEVHGRAIDYAGHRAVIGVLVDVTEQKRATQRMQRLNEELEARVAERTAALKASNDELRLAMAQLVQSEKLAALGGLVAGVAHELNTPLGNVLATASSLQDYAREFLDLVERGDPLRRSQLLEQARTSVDAANLIVRNAERAAGLVTNFRQVAVDQTSMQRRQFDLAEVIEESVALLQSRLRRAGHVLEMDVAAGIVMDSYPGALEQIIGNFVLNAINHAFAEGVSGRIWVAACLDDGRVQLRFSDNGLGMSTSIVARAFEPFFTTRLGKGGSGLGLYTVYNLVTALLGGSIDLVSAPGQGACFTLSLPLVAPVLVGADASAQA